MSGLICPYCGKYLGVADEYDAIDKICVCRCHYCWKKFVFMFDHDVSYYESKADCLNGRDHTYEKTVTFPVEFTILRGTQCGDEKPLKDENETDKT